MTDTISPTVRLSHALTVAFASGATALLAVNLLAPKAAAPATPAPSGPTGSITNPIDFTAPGLDRYDGSVKSTLIKAFVNSGSANNDRTITIPQDNLNKMAGIYDGKSVKVPTGDGVARTFEVSGKCVDGKAAVEIKENGNPAGAISGEDNRASASDVYAGRPIQKTGLGNAFKCTK